VQQITTTLGLLLSKELRSLFRNYYSYAVISGVVGRERSVGVPPQRLFRYEWMDVNQVIIRFRLHYSNGYNDCFLAVDLLLWFQVFSIA
jgi:hypothetical protein